VTTVLPIRSALLLVTVLVAGACTVDKQGLGSTGSARGGAAGAVHGDGGPGGAGGLGGGGAGGGAGDDGATLAGDGEGLPDGATAPDATRTCDPSGCAPCFRCGSSGACELDPGSRWKMRCVSAEITPTSPAGTAWDPGLGSPGQDPDPYCELRLGQVSVARTSVLSNTLEPVWNESITPVTRFTPAFLMSQDTPWSIRVADDDLSTFSSEDVCIVIPQLAPGAFTQDTIMFSDVQSCITLTVSLECDN
jgi:hypothetical protein